MVMPGATWMGAAFRSAGIGVFVAMFSGPKEIEEVQMCVNLEEVRCRSEFGWGVPWMYPGLQRGTGTFSICAPHIPVTPNVLFPF